MVHGSSAKADFALRKAKKTKEALAFNFKVGITKFIVYTELLAYRNK